MMDHRSPEFGALTREILPKLQAVFGTRVGSVVVYPGSGTGAWEASLVNVIAPGDRVLAFSCGYFSSAFADAARKLALVVDEVPRPWGEAIDPSDVEKRLRANGTPDHYRAILVMHNETSTGVESDIGAIRKAIDAVGHDALLIVDAVSSLASVPFAFDKWAVDIALSGSQKGLMLPPGLAILCVSAKAVAIGEHGGSPRNYWDWRPILEGNSDGFFPYTPATQLLVGLRAALQMIVDNEGLDAVYSRHRRLARGVRAALEAWRLAPICRDSSAYSQTVTGVVLPDDLARIVVDHARERYGLTLGIGLGELRKQTVRIGHLGNLNELEILATVAGLEMTLWELGVGIDLGSGVQAAQSAFLHDSPQQTIGERRGLAPAVT